MSKKYLFALALIFLFQITYGQIIDESFTDVAFRKHRYDSWKVLNLTEGSIVFAGDSITDMHLWSEAFGSDPRIVNRGNSGGISKELLDNADYWLRFKPAKVFIMIGTNDLAGNKTEQTIATTIQQTVDKIRSQSPQTEIYLQSILPAKNSGYKTLETIQATNALIEKIANNTENAHYIDLYSKLGGIIKGEPYSRDNLHLMAYGYKIWTEAIKEQIGITPIYPENTDKIQKTESLSGSVGLRATYFSTLPMKSTDILFFGDEMVKNGEWNELLHNNNIKNRGAFWNYGGNIKSAFNLVVAAFENSDKGILREQPEKILLYTGTEEVNNSTDMETIKNLYTSLIIKIKSYAPKTPIAVISIMPTEKENERITQFNSWLEQIAETSEGLTYIDIYTALSLNGKANPEYFVGNYIYGKGYLEIARILANYIGNCSVISKEEGEKLYESFNENKLGYSKRNLK